MPVESNLGILDRGERILLIHAHQQRAKLRLGSLLGLGALGNDASIISASIISTQPHTYTHTHGGVAGRERIGVRCERHSCQHGMSGGEKLNLSHFALGKNKVQAPA